MNFENTITKYDFLQSFYIALDEIVDLQDDYHYSASAGILAQIIPKAFLLFDLPENEKALSYRFNHFVDISLFNEYSLLKNLKESYMSIFEVIDENTVIDRILNKKLKLAIMPNDAIKGDFLFTRIIEIDNLNFFYGEILFLTSVHAQSMIALSAEPLSDWDKSFKEFGYHLMNYYVINSLDYSLFYDDEVWHTGAIATLFFNPPEMSLFLGRYGYESDEFYSILESISPVYLELMKENKNFSSFKRISFYSTLLSMAERGLFKSKSQLILCVESLLEIFRYFLKYSEVYRTAVYELQYAKSNIFELIKELNNSVSGLYYDESYLEFARSARVITDIEKIADVISDESLRESSNLSLTEKSVKILSESVSVGPVKEKKNYNSYSFPYVDFLYRFMRAKELLEYSSEISLGTFYYEFENLDDEEIMSLIYTSLLNHDFLNYIYPPIKVKYLLKKLELLKSNSLLTDEPDDRHFMEFFARLGLLEKRKNSYSLSDAAKKLFKIENNADNIIPFRN